MEIAPSSSPPHAAPDADSSDPQAAVQSDFPCRQCAYNLRGLTHTGQCPECGAAVAFSVSGDLLRYSNPDWLRIVARGAGLLGLKVVLLLGLVLFELLFLLLRLDNLVLEKIGLLVINLIGILGLFAATRLQPGGPNPGRAEMMRRVARTLLVIAPVCEIIIQFWQMYLTPGSILADEVLSLVQPLLFGLGETALFVYFRSLLLRVPRPSLARRATLLAWAGAAVGIICCLRTIISITLGGLTRLTTGGFAILVFESLVGSMLLLAPAVGALQVGFFVKFRRLLREQARIARLGLAEGAV